MIIRVFVLLMNLLWAAAAPPQLTATVSKPKVRPGEGVQLRVSVKTEDEVEVEEPHWNIPAGVENQGVQTQTAFESRLIPGPNGMQFEKKRAVEFVYNLQIEREGSFTLGPFKVIVSGQAYSVAAVSVEVSKRAPPAQQMPRGWGGVLPPGFEDEEDGLLGQLLRRQRTQEREVPSRQLPINEKEAFFVLLETDKKEVFEGEQIFASWYIYTRGNIHQFDRLKFPDLKGFWKEDVEPAPSLNFEQERVNGVLFRRALLASYALFPIKAGKAVIDDYKIRAIVSLPSSGFGGFGFGQPYSYTRTSAPLEIIVKPLPQEGKPENFSGAIGTFKVEAHVENQKFVQGQPFSLKLRFDGDGNAKLIELPNLQWPSTFELYDTKADSRFFQSGKSYKEFTLLVIPKASGVLKLPPFVFSYFDPLSATYKTIQTQEISLQVEPGKVVTGESERMKVAEKVKSEDTRLPDPAQQPVAQTWHWLTGLPMFFTWTAAYFFLFVSFILGHWIWLKRLYRKKRLIDDLGDRRQKWEKQIRSSHLPLSATEVINAIYYILGRLVEQGEFSKDLSYFLEHLPPSVRNEVAEPLRKELEVLQTVAFAPPEAWKDFSKDGEFRKHSEHVFELLRRTILLSEEGTLPEG